MVRREPAAFERHQSGLREEILAGMTKVVWSQGSFQESLHRLVHCSEAKL
jgi:hypothetical protein